MAGQKCETASAREAVEALRELASQARTASGSADRFVWSADALDELARVADVLGRAVEDVAGDESSAVRAHADQLATAIVAHRNSLLRHGVTPASGGQEPQTAPSPRDGRIPAGLPR
jgi:hypothetical protein